MAEDIAEELPHLNTQVIREAAMCGRLDRKDFFKREVGDHRYRLEGCLPPEEEEEEEDTDTEDEEDPGIEQDAAVELISQKLLDMTCSVSAESELAVGPWPERCARELSYTLRSGRKTYKTYEAVCQAAPDGSQEGLDPIERIADSIQSGTFGPFPFGSDGAALPCYQKLGAMAALEQPRRSLELHALAKQSISALCQRTGSEAPLERGCAAAPSRSVERCADALLKFMGSDPLVYRRFCSKSEDDFAAHTGSGRTKWQDYLLYKAESDRYSLKKFGAAPACGQFSDREALLASVDAAFKCACPVLRKALPPSPPEEKPAEDGATVRRKRAELWARLTGAEASDPSSLENVLATAAAERPSDLQDILELAVYPVYEEGPLAHLQWPRHYDVRFAIGGRAEEGRSLPEVMRLFRFATGNRLSNGNAGDLAHVCAWGRAAAMSNAAPYMLESRYALFIYSVKTDGVRTGYSKCNGNSCWEGARGLGMRYKDLGREGGCYDGPSNWYSLPEAGSGETWTQLSLDRVVQWSCVIKQGVYSNVDGTASTFRRLDKILFSLEGCAACPDFHAPDNSPRRVCPQH